MVLSYCEWHMRHGPSYQSSSSPVTRKCSIDCPRSTQVTTAYSRNRSTGRNYSLPSATLCGIHICVHPSRKGASRRRDFNAHPSTGNMLALASLQDVLGSKLGPNTFMED